MKAREWELGLITEAQLRMTSTKQEKPFYSYRLFRRYVVGSHADGCCPSAQVEVLGVCLSRDSFLSAIDTTRAYTQIRCTFRLAHSTRSLSFSPSFPSLSFCSAAMIPPDFCPAASVESSSAACSSSSLVSRGKEGWGSEIQYLQLVLGNGYVLQQSSKNARAGRVASLWQ